jgi:protein-disulfide isomerase
VSPLAGVTVPGFEAFRVERRSPSRYQQPTNAVLADGARGEVLVGDVFDDPARRRAGRPFDPAADIPNIQSSLAGAFGLPVRVRVAPSPRGALWPLSIEVRQRADAILGRTGYVSNDGSLLAVGEFQSLSETPAAYRRRLLAERPGVRVGSGKFLLTEFLDFQCERCRARAPEIEKAVVSRGGAVEARFLPLVNHHDWAFAAAEQAAALGALDPRLYARYRDAIFARAASMTETGCREIAADLAESAGASERLKEEVTSGRARDRVLSDMRLAMRLGISTTPSFVLDGTLMTSEEGLVESRIFEKYGTGAAEKR